MAMSLHSFCTWLSETPISLTIQNTSWIIPTVQSIHIMCVALVFSSALLVDLRLLGVMGRQVPVADYGARFLKWIWPTLLVLLATGTILITAEPARSLENPSFQIKMVLLILAMIATAVLQRRLAGDPDYWHSTGGRKATARLIALASMVLWIGIIFAGRWIAYASGK